MQMFEIAAFAGAFAFVVYALGLASSSSLAAGTWRIPAAFSFAFLAFSVYCVAVDGPTGFWPVHSQSAWGNQVWFDLLLAAGVSLAFLVPEARKHGMNPLPWVVLVILTGSIGLLAMVARILYLKEVATISGSAATARAL
ncbi:MAG TPA: hypothetical protein VLQ68_06390 [Rhizobiaceae bacterium]|nr:hypothetical protein [Rhizobiaceae bacterium]